jgi:hypothetical protein
MADKDFKVKTGLDLPAPLPLVEGGTGQTTANNALNAMLPSQTTHGSKILGTDGTNTTWVNPGAAYQTSAPNNPVTGQLWVDSDETGDSLDPYIIRRKTITATAGQTVFTTDVVFTDGYEQIYYNGVLLVRTTDYTTSGGTNTVTLLQGASAGDTVEIISSTPINLVNTATLNTNTFTGNQIVASNSYISVGDRSNIGVSGATPLNGININNSSSRPRVGFFDSVGGDTTGSSIGTLEFFDYLKSGQAEKRSAVIEVVRDGSSSTQRGGAIIFNTVPNASNTITERMRINSLGDISITTAYATLSGVAGNGQWRIRGKYTGDTSPYPSEMLTSVNWNTVTNTQDTAVNGSAYTSLYGASGGGSGFVLYTGGNGATPTEKFRVDSTGTGYATAPNWTFAPVSGGLNTNIKIRNSHYSDGSPNHLILGVDGTMFNGVAYLDTSNAGVAGATPLSFRVSGTERARINANGNFGVGWSPDNNWHLSVNSGSSVGAGAFLSTASTNIIGGLFENSNASFTNNLVKAQTFRSNNAGFIYYSAVSNVTVAGDTDWYVRGDGQVYTDGSTSMSTPADYAEYFEWADGNINNEDRAGYSVSLTNGTQIKIAESGEDVIGIVSANPAVVGDAAWNMWIGKYKKDQFNRYVRDENGDRILSEDFDPESEYVSREERPEWSPVGLVGKLRMHKGQITDSRWIKMRDISDEIEEWLLR